MTKKANIPLNTMIDKFGSGVAIGRASITDFRMFKEAAHAHRDDYYLFFLQEAGTSPIEIDFQKYEVDAFSVVYIHPNQVHRMTGFQNVTVSFCAIARDYLNAEYVKIFEEIAPVAPLPLDEDSFWLIYDTVSLCVKLSGRNQEKLHHSLLKDGCNTFAGLVAAQYIAQSATKAGRSRYEIIAKDFKALLEQNFIVMKKPAAYADLLHISLPYLSECLKNATGYSVSHHIQQRIILEAKRILYHSDKPVKEIALFLGYEDFTYFSRLFKKATGSTPLSFRHKNLD